MTDDAPGSSSYRFTRDMSGRSLWVRVDGGDLPMPIDIRVDRAQDGRHVFTGIRIGGESGTQEITSQTLRQIRLAEILAAHFEHFEPIFQMEASLAEVSYPLRPRGRGPDDQALRDFARTYQIELARQPRRAMSAAAKAHSISRATANRWAAVCRQLGYLPGSSKPGAE